MILRSATENENTRCLVSARNDNACALERQTTNGIASFEFKYSTVRRDRVEGLRQRFSHSLTK